MDKIKELLEKKQKRAKAIEQQLVDFATPEERRAAKEALDEIRGEISTLEETINEELKAAAIGGGQNTPEPRAINPSLLNPLPGQKRKENRETDDDDPFATIEYRKAFKNYVQRGIQIPQNLIPPTGMPQPQIQAQEGRLDAMTTVAYASALVPSTIMPEVIRDLKNYGVLLPLVRIVNVPGGISFPVSNLIPTASWITEASPSDRQRADINQAVTFSYYGLECKISKSLLASIVTLSAFETEIASLLSEAFAQAMDIAIIAGAGTTQPTGVTVEASTPAAITMTEDELKSWSSWKTKIFAKMPKRYKNNAVIITNDSTWEAYIDGMVSSEGVPIARQLVGIAGEPIDKFNGKQIVTVEDDVIEPFDTASSGEVIAVMMNPKFYAVNTNMNLYFSTYIDNDKNEIINKGIMVADGRLLHLKSVLIIKKA